MAVTLGMTDMDLPALSRTEANLYKANYFAALKELRNANRGIQRLVGKVDRLKRAIDWLNRHPEYREPKIMNGRAYKQVCAVCGIDLPSTSETNNLLIDACEALEIACDFLEPKYEMESVPLTQVAEARNQLRKVIGETKQWKRT